MFGDRDNLARAARKALNAEAAARVTSLAEAKPDVWNTETRSAPSPQSLRAPDRGPGEVEEDYIELSLSRSHRDRLSELAAELLELPEDRAVSAAAYELASLVSRWDTNWRVSRGLRSLRWMRGL